MLKWLIIGGGIHGTHLSHALTTGGAVPRERLRVLDPQPAALARWHANSTNTGMAYLRSPVVHHLDLEPTALKRFAAAHPEFGEYPYIGRYKRPSLALFNAHTQSVIETHQLEALRVKGRARALHRKNRHFVVDTDHGELEARRVALAIGLCEQPLWPAWAQDLARAGSPLYHVFDRAFERRQLPPWNHAVVIGGGITAAQTALAMAERQPGTVTLVSRHPLHVKEFDSNPCWLGPRCMDRFQREKDMSVRRRLIVQGRQPGTIPPDVDDMFNKALEEGRLAFQTGAVQQAKTDNAMVSLRLEDGSSLETDCVILCTGFDSRRPGAPWLDRTIAQLGLPCAPCGYPLVDTTLQWQKGVFVMGPLAELEIGPVARNISGARFAAQRIVEAALLGHV